MSNEILPANIEMRIEFWCNVCEAYVVDGKPRCPIHNAELPPLGVYVSDSAGATGKIGG